MNHRQTRGRVVALGIALVVAVAVAACGGSSPASTTSTTTSAANVNATSPSASGQSALVACLKRYGVSLPGGAFPGRGRFGATGASGRFRAGGGFFGATGASGRRGSFFGATGATGASGRRGSVFGATGASGRRGFGGGAFANNPKFAAAFAKCRGVAGLPAGGFGGRRFGATGPAALGGAALRTQLAKFVTCMKGKGVELPTPNLSGTGSVFGTTVNTKSSKFRTAFEGCESTLPAALRGAGAAPPAA